VEGVGTHRFGVLALVAIFEGCKLTPRANVALGGWPGSRPAVTAADLASERGNLFRGLPSGVVPVFTLVAALVAIGDAFLKGGVAISFGCFRVAILEPFLLLVMSLS